MLNVMPIPLVKIDKKTGVLYRQWQTPSPEAVFLLVHGLGAHSGRWRFFADFFLANNISSYAIELKGFGQTQGPRGHVDSFNTYYNDIGALCRLIEIENPNKKVFLVGESMGALICLFVALDRDNIFDGVICISPAFANRIKFSALDYIKFLFYLLFDPKRQMKMPIGVQWCTRDIEYQRYMEADPLEYHVATPKLLLNLLICQLVAFFLKIKVMMPLLFLIAGDDKIVSSSQSKNIFKKIEAGDKDVIEYPCMRHALSIELEKEKVFADILKWINKRL